MKVLYLWNTAGALTPVIEWLIENGHDARLVMRQEFDFVNHSSYLDCAIMVDTARDYYNAILDTIAEFDPDVIHSNSSLIGVILSRFKAPRTPIVLMYHGSEIRGRKGLHSEAKLADKVIVSTPDIAEYAEWFDRPVKDIFEDKGGRVSDTAIMFYADHYMKDLREDAQQWCDKRGINLDIIYLEAGKHTKHDEMPTFLSKYEYMLDFKGYEHPKAISLIAIEALKCGCKVVSDTNPSQIITLDNYELKTPADYLELYRSLNRPSVLRTIARAPRLLLGLVKLALGRLDF